MRCIPSSILRREVSAVFTMVWPLTPRSDVPSSGTRTHPCPNNVQTKRRHLRWASWKPYTPGSISRYEIPGIISKGLTTENASIDRRIQSRVPRQTRTESARMGGASAIIALERVLLIT